MKKLSITGKFEGEIIAVYNAEGWLVCFDLQKAKLSVEQITILWNDFPYNQSGLTTFLTAKRLTAKEVIEQISFEQFYNTYNVKEGRKRAEAVWNRMSAVEQRKAFDYIPVLRSKKQINGQAMPHPITYLNQTRWND